jgi:hypothetical protein
MKARNIQCWVVSDRRGVLEVDPYTDLPHIFKTRREATKYVVDMMKLDSRDGPYIARPATLSVRASSHVDAATVDAQPK